MKLLHNFNALSDLLSFEGSVFLIERFEKGKCVNILNLADHVHIGVEGREFKFGSYNKDPPNTQTDPKVLTAIFDEVFLQNWLCSPSAKRTGLFCF